MGAGDYEYGHDTETHQYREVEELEIEIAENTTNIRHCNTTNDCYKIFRDHKVECVRSSTFSAIKHKEGSSGTCQRQGCQRNNDNCYQGELCIKNHCVPVSQVAEMI